MGRIWKYIMDMPISRKFVVMVYSVVVIMFISLSFLLVIQAEQSSKQTLIENDLDTVKTANLLIEKEQQYLYGIAEYYSITPAVQEFLKRSNDFLFAESLGGDITQVVRARMYVVGLAFYNLKGVCIDYMTIDNSKHPVDQNEDGRPFKTLIDEKKKFVWEFIDQGEEVYMLQDNSPKLCLWYLINDTKTLRPIGVVAISVDSRKLITAENIPDNLYTSLTVLDLGGREVFNNSYSFSEETRLKLRKLSENSSGYFITQLDGIEYRIVYAKVAKSNLISYLIVPNLKYTWNIYNISVQAVTGIVLCTIILLPIVILITKTLTDPIKKLTMSMTSFSMGNLDASVSFEYNDEIGQLGRVFNKAVKEQKQLIEQKYMLELREKEAELSSLQAQINPHFLYNMINGIQWLALQRGDNEIADLAYSMGQVFHISLNSGNKLITVKQEKDLILYYLKLQKRRFGERVAYNTSFAPETESLKIPKLIIQPLIENSIVHGAENNTSTIHINVACYLKEEDNRLIIEVSDDGCGIPEDLLKFLPDNPPLSKSGVGSRYALRNISERLKLTYGSNYSFTIESVYGEGVFIKVDLPVLNNLNE